MLVARLLCWLRTHWYTGLLHIFATVEHVTCTVTEYSIFRLVDWIIEIVCDIWWYFIGIGRKHVPESIHIFNCAQATKVLLNPPNPNPNTSEKLDLSFPNLSGLSANYPLTVFHSHTLTHLLTSCPNELPAH